MAEEEGEEVFPPLDASAAAPDGAGFKLVNVPASLDSCQSVEEVALYLPDYWNKHKNLPGGGFASELETILNKAMTALQKVSHAQGKVTCFSYEGNLTPVEFREMLVALIQPEFAEEHGLQKAKTHYSRFATYLPPAKGTRSDSNA